MIALITGVTSGIGRSIAHKLAGEKYDLIVTGRREDRLKQLADDLQKEFGIQTLPLVFDVRSRDQVEKAIEGLPNQWKEIDVLVNNAGLALGLSTIEEGDIDDWDTMIDTNVKGLLYVSRAVLPGMKERKKGHVVNIGSTAGKEAYLKGNVYCGTKHAVDAISKSMRMDLLPYGIKVTQVCPGMVETEFSLVRFKGDQERAENVYKGFQPLKPEDVAEVVRYALSVPEHVCLNDIVLTAKAQANSFYTERQS